MKTKNLFLTGALLALVTAVVIGCTSLNPAHATDPTQPVYVVNPKLTQGVETANNVAGATAPFNPYAPLTNPLVYAIGSIALNISQWWANQKNKKGLDSMAEAIVVGGPTVVSNALKIAGANGATVVSRHIDNNTPTTTT